MKWFTCIVHNPHHVTPVQYFHIRADTATEAEANAFRSITDGDPKMTDTAYRDLVDVPFVFEGKLEPVVGAESAEMLLEAVTDKQQLGDQGQRYAVWIKPAIFSRNGDNEAFAFTEHLHIAASTADAMVKHPEADRTWVVDRVSMPTIVYTVTKHSG